MIVGFHNNTVFLYYTELYASLIDEKYIEE